MVKSIAKMLDGAMVQVVTSAGLLISEHPITGWTSVGSRVWATVGPAIATGTGMADHIDILSDGAPLITGGSLTLDFPAIDEGADVLLDPIRLEA